MFKTSLLVTVASMFFALPALAADFSFTGEAPQMICEDDGNCYHTHAPPFVEHWQDDDGAYERPGYRSRYGAPGAGVYRNFDDGPAIDVDVDDDPW